MRHIKKMLHSSTWLVVPRAAVGYVYDTRRYRRRRHQRAFQAAGARRVCARNDQAFARIWRTRGRRQGAAFHVRRLHSAISARYARWQGALCPRYEGMSIQGADGGLMSVAMVGCCHTRGACCLLQHEALPFKAP